MLYICVYVLLILSLIRIRNYRSIEDYINDNSRCFIQTKGSIMPSYTENDIEIPKSLYNKNIYNTWYYEHSNKYYKDILKTHITNDDKIINLFRKGNYNSESFDDDEKVFLKRHLQRLLNKIFKLNHSNEFTIKQIDYKSHTIYLKSKKYHCVILIHRDGKYHGKVVDMIFDTKNNIYKADILGNVIQYAINDNLNNTQNNSHDVNDYISKENILQMSEQEITDIICNHNNEYIFQDINSKCY